MNRERRNRPYSGVRSPWSRHSLRLLKNRKRSNLGTKKRHDAPMRIGVVGNARTTRSHASRSTVAVAVTKGSIAMLVVIGSAAPALASGALVLIPDLFGMLPIMIVAFALMIFPLNKLLFQPIFRALDARAERIAGARERSEQLQRDADQVLDQYETAIREARGASEASRQTKLEGAREEQIQLTAKARSEAEREIESARGELTRSIEDARASLRSSAEGLATAAAERVLGRALS